MGNVGCGGPRDPASGKVDSEHEIFSFDWDPKDPEHPGATNPGLTGSPQRQPVQAANGTHQPIYADPGHPPGVTSRDIHLEQPHQEPFAESNGFDHAGHPMDAYTGQPHDQEMPYGQHSPEQAYDPHYGQPGQGIDQHGHIPSDYRSAYSGRPQSGRLTAMQIPATVGQETADLVEKILVRPRWLECYPVSRVALIRVDFDRKSILIGSPRNRATRRRWRRCAIP